MKTKEIIQLVVAVLILAIAGLLLYSTLGPKKAAGSDQVTYEKITMINPQFNTDYLDRMANAQEFRDFYTDPDLQNGLGNSSPFGPLR